MRIIFAAGILVTAMGCGAERIDLPAAGFQGTAEAQPATEALPVPAAKTTTNKSAEICLAFISSENERIAAVPLINSGVDWMVSASARTNRMLAVAQIPERGKLIPMFLESDLEFFDQAEPDDWPIIQGNAMRASYRQAVEIAEQQD